ncbi:OsmC family protein [Sandaracinus amylolyticus]|uniref:OsmC/Ohr family protein n=1 Tax=Sandaracinus amylolyticus TaxID=927083 RepID=A0A0F6SH57_9BACT|nr:OsmC family protein [Sandaracinus amylolyticus]AKF09864.1 hypothetical protein DB32_007013 [Sandaracinus amylolyticus]
MKARTFVRTHLFGDEPWTDGEARPRELLLAALGACTRRAIEALARRRAWELGDVAIEISHVERDGRTGIGRLVHVDATLDDAQRAELERACEDTPVTRVLSEGATITTQVLAGA